jgi:hypothetical protein
MMQRIAFVCLMTAGFLGAWPVAGGDKKPSPKSLAEDAQLLAGKGWTSDEEFSIVSSKNGDPKCKLTLTYSPVRPQIRRRAVPPGCCPAG